MGVTSVTRVAPTQAPTQGPIDLFPLLKILLLILVMVVISYGTHAIVKHGLDAVQVRDCMNKNGPIQTWVKPDGRVVHICEIEPGKFGLMITDGIREVTSFIKEKMTKISQVENYLRNMGASRIYYP